MENRLVYRQGNVNGGPFSGDIQAENPEKSTRANAERKVMEWEASQGPNAEPLSDEDREEMIQEYVHEMKEDRSKIEDTLGKAA